MSAEQARADGPGAGPPWMVAVGDSAISGEGGRWAGNTNVSSVIVDALGEDAYHDGHTPGPITHFTNHCVDVANGSSVDGTEIRLHNCNGTAAQTWRMLDDFTVRALGKCLTVNGTPVNGALIELRHCRGVPSQRWKRVSNRLQHMVSRRCLDVPGPNPGPLTRLRLWDCREGIPGSFQIFPAPASFEKVEGCHRSRSAPVHINRSMSGGLDVPNVLRNTMNFACSGAKTFSTATKPGVDFASAPPNTSPDHRGQAELLREFASSHDVKAVALLVGANNLGFAPILKQCIKDFLLSVGFWQDHCQDDSDVAWRVTEANFAAIQENIETAITNVRSAMLQAGYQESAFAIFVHTYWSFLPEGFAIRYPEDNDRQTIGGCGVWNADADWAFRIAFKRLNAAIRAAVAELNFASGLPDGQRQVACDMAGAFAPAADRPESSGRHPKSG